jgi:TolB-like protein/Tfp pilus assembly protein PilF
VLPFENLSPDPDNAYFAAGIHESTLNQLSKVRDIVVISRRSVSQYEGKAALITDIAEELKVEKIMEGSVRYADGRVLISVQLIDGRNGANIWSESYERQLTDIFGVQAEVAERITDAMQIQLLPEDRARIATRQTHSSEALQYYLEALGMPSAESRPEYTDAYIGSLERAIALDPAFVEPVAELAIYYMNTGNAGEAARYAQSAIELDPQNGVGYVARGSIRKYFFDRQQEAQADLERALVLSPNNSRVLMNYCYRGADQGRDAQDYVRYCRRAVAIDPTSAMAHRRLAAVFIRTGNISEAMDHLNEAIEINPAGTHEPYVELAIAHYLAGDPDSARSSLDRAMQVMSSGATYRVDYIAYVYGLLGDIEVANDMVTSVTETAQQSQGDENIGWGLLGTRDKDRALEYWAIVVDKYINEGRPVSSGRISRFRDNWLNDPILEEPEFLQLRRRLGYEG